MGVLYIMNSFMSLVLVCLNGEGNFLLLVLKNERKEKMDKYDGLADDHTN